MIFMIGGSKFMAAIALVTGANKGIGKEISRQLASKGVLVIMGARNPERGEKAVADLRAEGLAPELVELDVTSQQSIDLAAAEIERRHGRLDILVNNAGIALDWVPGSEMTVEELEKTFDTNLFGVFRVTKAMLRLLQKSQHGRIVNLSSSLGSLTLHTGPNGPFAGQNMLVAYSASKAALNMLTIKFANELRSAGIKVNSADPGYTATDMNQYRGPRTVAQGAATPVRLALLPDDGPTGGVFSDDGRPPW
jgi:NAD(P)-dependent dehydrogenase (short-subunit alcohol dehydrogenase family)